MHCIIVLFCAHACSYLCKSLLFIDQTAECHDPSGLIAAIVFSTTTFILICLVIVLIPFAVYGCYKLCVRQPAERQADGERVPFVRHQNQNIAGGGINDANNDA